MATMMLEINRLSIELEKANKKPRELSDDEIITRYRELMSRSSI
jgi:hypothetical protein